MAMRIIRKYANSVRVVICMVGLLAMQFHIPVRIRHCNRFIHYVQYWV